MRIFYEENDVEEEKEDHVVPIASDNTQTTITGPSATTVPLPRKSIPLSIGGQLLRTILKMY